MSDRGTIRLSLITLGLLAVAVAPAAAWGPAVHTYVADHLGKGGLLNTVEIYGAVLPDVCYFAYDLDPAEQAACAAVVHEPYGPWEAASNLGERALGFGYASHNNDWGADRTAHHPLWGYIVTRARVFAVMLKGVEPLDQLPFEAREAIAHTVLEAATDVLVRRMDPQIGNKLATAAGSRPAWVPAYLAGVYGDPELALLEGSFQYVMGYYGQALAAPTEEGAVQAIAALFAPFAGNWLPDGVVLEDPEQMIAGLIRAGMALTEKDFACTLAITTRSVRWNLWWHGVWY